MFRLGKVNKKEGEIKPNNKGTLMKIIKYRNYNDIDVEFLDDHHFIKEHQIYVNFKNGSEIRSIGESKDSKRGYIRGRRLTDEEYQRMIYCEQVKAEEKLDEILKILGLK